MKRRTFLGTVLGSCAVAIVGIPARSVAAPHPARRLVGPTVEFIYDLEDRLLGFDVGQQVTWSIREGAGAEQLYSMRIVSLDRRIESTQVSLVGRQYAPE